MCKYQVTEFLKKKINLVKASNNVLNKEASQRFFNVPPNSIDSADFKESKLPYFYR